MRDLAARMAVAFGLALAAVGVPSSHAASGNLQSPPQFFGYTFGDDDRIPRWQQVIDYHRHLSVATDRVRFEQVGLSWQKRPMILATVSSPANLARLEEIRQIQLKLADPREVLKTDLPNLVRRGRAVMLFFVAEAEHTAAWLGQMQFIHQLASSESEEVRRWLDNTVLLFMSTMNPDGLDFVYDWVEKTRGTQWQGEMPPELSSLLGEINRDWYTFAMPESRAVVSVMKRWQPNAIHDIHTMGAQPRTWARLFVPPFTGPVEPNIHPLIWHLQNEMGMAMAGRVIERQLPGVTFGTQYDLWNPARGYAQHHHTLRILSESSPPRLTTPTTIRFEDLTVEGGLDPRKPSVQFPLVWYGGEWGNKQILPYVTTVLEAEVKHLADNRERYLRAKYTAAADTLAKREPAAYLVPPDQHDPSAVGEMLDMLSFGEIEIYRAQGPLRADGASYPAGTYFIPLTQPFGNWAKAMLEPQAYPEIRACPQCPIDAPYDTVAFSYPYAMGVKVVAVKDVAGPVLRVMEFPAQGGSVTPPGKPWYLLATNENTAYKAVARLLKENANVARTLSAFDAQGKPWPAGTFLVQGAPNIEKQLAALARELGLEFVGQDQKPPAPAMTLRLPRVAVYRPHVGGRNGYGHARLLFPEYGIPFEFVVDADIRKGDLRERFDSLVLPSYVSPQELMQGRAAGSSPPELTGGIGGPGVENLRRFVESGGTLVALDRANDFVINQLKLPVVNVSGATVRMFGRPGSTDAADKPGPQLTIPGSFLRIAADMKHPIAFGMPSEFSGMFNRGQVLESNGPDSVSVASYPEGDLLLSGMALGAGELRGKSAVMEVKQGAGRVVLFGIRPELRLQTRGTYKLLLNTLYLSAAERD